MSVKAWEDGPSYIDMPRGMDSYSAPVLPEPDKVRHLHGARETMRWLRSALLDWRDGLPPLIADLSNLDAENRELIDQILGEGEVSVTCTGALRARTQEAVLAGVWRTLYFDEDDRVAADLLEVGDAPHVARVAPGTGMAIDISEPAEPESVLNALAILVELETHAAAFDRDGAAHAINLSLLPLTDDDLEFLEQRLGRGAVDVLSSAYGTCQVTSTLVPNVWWVRYFNSMGTPILSSLEVVAVPVVVKAAVEDLRDSAARLDELLEPYWGDVG